MQRPLDSHSFKRNTYERPNQEWVCGHAAEGRSCPLGPDARGNCRNTGECLPAKNGDRWTCTRNEAQGGKCSEGPLPNGACAHPIPPCQPVCSLRRSRALAVWVCVAVTAGALLIPFGVGQRQAWIDPGALTNAHAPFAGNCADCHTAGSAPVTRLVSDSLRKRTAAESALCLKCHALGDQPLRAHSLPPAVLAEKRGASSAAPGGPVFLRASRAVAAPAAHGSEIACATCHQEHHGRNFDLKQLSNAKCQSCHATQFASFKKGHPQFASYPSQRRTRIFFDHNSHLQQHFAERQDLAPAGCQTCHVTGPAGKFMQVKNFNASCAACHAPQIKGEGMTNKGVAFFTVPGVDAETLAARGLSVGEWPKFADTQLTPFMELMLRDDPQARAALDQLAGVDLLDLTKAMPEQLAAAEQFAWSVKSLLFHLVVEGQSFLIREMKEEVTPAGLEVPREALLAAQKEWMPHLLDEVSDYRKGIKPPLPAPAEPATAATPAPTAPVSTGGDDSLVGDDPDLLDAPAPAPDAAKPAATPADDLLAGGSDDDLTNGDLSAAAPDATPTPVPSAAAPATVAAEDWVAAGGWYRPQDSFTLFYRPVGHADPFVVAWLNAAAHLRANRPRAAGARDPFQLLAAPQNPGLCLKCHTVEQSGSAAIAVNWTPANANTKARPFTTFSHSTHMSLTGDAGCQKCHALEAKSQYPKFFARENATAPLPSDPHQFQSNFAPIVKATCAECHQPRVAGNECVLCHRYHAAPADGKMETGTFTSFSPPVKAAAPAMSDR